VSVSQMGGRPRWAVGASVGCPPNEDVGIGVPTACPVYDPPEMGTIVGTNVGVGWAVGCAETGLGFAPIDSLHASSSPSISNP